MSDRDVLSKETTERGTQIFAAVTTGCSSRWDELHLKEFFEVNILGEEASPVSVWIKFFNVCICGSLVYIATIFSSLN